MEKQINDILHSATTLECHLMSLNPVSGGTILSFYFDEFPIFKLGWNISKNGMYVLITPEYGITTAIKPDVPDEEISIAQDDFSFQNSIANKKLNALEIAILNLFSLVKHDRAMSEKLEKVLQTKTNILKFSSLAEIEIDQIVRKEYEKLQEELIFNSTLENPNYGGSIKLAHSVIQSYLTYEITGEIAAKILSYFIVAFCKFTNETFVNNPSNPKIELVLLKNCVEYLQELHERLLRIERTKYNLLSYYSLTYLATLYGQIAIEVIKIMKLYFPLEAQPQSWCTKKYKAIDELNVHYGYSTFLYPAALKPYSRETYFEAILFSKNHRIEYVYPQIKNKIPVQDFEKVFSVVENETAALPNLDLNSKDYPIVKPNIMFDLGLIKSLYE